MKAYLKNYRQSPRKVRLVADVARGKTVPIALSELTFLNKRASLAVKKLISSAVANAKHDSKVDEADLIVREIRVDDGLTLKRYRARARGRAMVIRGRSSNILVELEAIEKKEKKEVKKAEAKPVKKTEKQETKEKAPKKTTKK